MLIRSQMLEHTAQENVVSRKCLIMKMSILKIQRIQLITMQSGQSTIIPIAEWRGFWGGFPCLNITKPPFKVTFSEVIIIWYNFSSTSAAHLFQVEQPIQDLEAAPHFDLFICFNAFGA